MKNFKNYLIAVLAGLLVLSLSIQPSQGAPKDTPAKLVQYENCLKVYAESNLQDVKISIGLQFSNYISQIVLNCATYKPSDVVVTKTAQYRECLLLADQKLRYSQNLPRDKETDIWDAGGLKSFVTHIQTVCRPFRP